MRRPRVVAEATVVAILVGSLGWVALGAPGVAGVEGAVAPPTPTMRVRGTMTATPVATDAAPVASTSEPGSSTTPVPTSEPDAELADPLPSEVDVVRFLGAARREVAITAELRGCRRAGDVVRAEAVGVHGADRPSSLAVVVELIDPAGIAVATAVSTARPVPGRTTVRFELELDAGAHPGSLRCRLAEAYVVG